jgi:DNA-binding transcriptional LysR family regulator
MMQMPKENDESLGFRHLRALSLLLDVGNLTHVAEILETNQPTVSKALRKLRAHFGDPLFVRVGSSMHPTPRALEIADPVRKMLSLAEDLGRSKWTFDPGTSSREFKVLVSEVGMIVHVLPLTQELERAGRSLRLKAVPLDSRQFASKLETGEADVAFGAFPRAAGSLKRLRLYSDVYVSVVRKDHPRLNRLGRLGTFLDERHIVVTASSTGHAAHQQLEQVLVSRLKPQRILMSVAGFLTCAFVASRTDAVGTMPAKLAEHLASDLGLTIFAPPLTLPRIEISMLWHERVSRDAGHQWFRSRCRKLFRRP